MLARIPFLSRAPTGAVLSQRWLHHAHSFHEQILPMEIRYDPETEMPVLCDVQMIDHVSNLYIPNTRYLLHANLSRYTVPNILTEIYLHIKRKESESKIQLQKTKETKLTLTDYRGIVKMLEMFGSLYVYQVGTCVKKCDHDRISVVVDKGLRRTINKNIAALTPPSMVAGHCQKFSMQWTKPTGYVMWSVPMLLLVYDAFRVRRGVMDFCHPKLRRELLEEGMNLDEANEIVDGQGFKPAVEIERSVIKQGNFVFFMEAEAARNTDQVLLELGKLTEIDIAIFLLVPHPDYMNPPNVFCYRLEDNRTNGLS